jgi:retron-type reverse transcriptase
MNQNKIQRWETIEKTKLSRYDKQLDVSRELKEAASEFTYSQSVNLLNIIYISKRHKLENQIPLEKHGDLYSIISSPDILRLAYRKLSKNKGALTPGTQGSTADDVSEEYIQKLSQRLKDETFKWSRTRRIWIPKPGKTELRPLGLPDFSNKIVQDAIRLVLEAIYEPIFEHYSCNYGFRKNLSCNEAIEHIDKHFNGTDYFIEGDIKGAYDSVDHEILMTILSKQISCTKTLKLIKSGLKAGISDMGQNFDSFLGIPQGGIASPILFNIYMHEFDEYIIKQLRIKYESIPKSDSVTTEYATNKSSLARTRQLLDDLKNTSDIKSAFKKFTIEDIDELMKLNPLIFNQISSSPWYKQKIEKNNRNYNEFEIEAIRKYQRLRNKDNNTKTTPLSEYSIQEQEAIRRFNVDQVTKRRFKQDLLKRILPLISDWKQLLMDFVSHRISLLKGKQLEIPYFNPEKKVIKIEYVRYADDWIVGVRGSINSCQEILQDIDNYLSTQLKLTLSREKTKITDIRNSCAKFLGYEIYYQRNPLIRRRSQDDKHSIQRFSKIQFHPDVSRLESRFLLKNIMNNDGTPKEVGFLTVLEDHEIIEKYNQFMIGLGNYYIRTISYKSRLNRWIYLLYWSCIKTLACKHRKTTKAIIQDYGYLDLTFQQNQKNKDIPATDYRIIAPYTYDGEIRYQVLYNYKECMYRLFTIKQNHKTPSPTIDFLCLHKVNFRTAFKLRSDCAICRSRYKLQNHHISPIKHAGGIYKGFKGFDKVIASLGRKQITVCGHCHIKIHNGEYDSLKLEHFYDLRLVPSEGYLDLSEFGDPTHAPDNKIKVGNNYVLDHKNKTIYNEFIKNNL